MHIVHVAIWTRDLELAAAFWRKYFSAQVGEAYYSKRRPGFVSRFVDLPSGGARIELMTGRRLLTDHIGLRRLGQRRGRS